MCCTPVIGVVYQHGLLYSSPHIYLFMVFIARLFSLIQGRIEESVMIVVSGLRNGGLGA